VTVSWNRFENHDKVMLIGSSDNAPADGGKLKVTSITICLMIWVSVHRVSDMVRYISITTTTGSAIQKIMCTVGVWGIQSAIYAEILHVG